jgi:iron complex outermembrane receptor protein
VIYRRDISNAGALELTGYYTPRHLGPFQQIGVRIPQDFTNRGGDARYLHVQPNFGLANRFTVGAEFQDTPITTGVFNSVTGAASSDLEEHATTIGAYVLEELSILPTLTLSGAARFDWVHFTSEDLTKAKGQVGRVYRKVTPKVGVTFQPLRSLATYATYSQGFEAPIIGELRITPDGSYGFNGALNEQTSDNYEVGARGAVFGDRLAFEAAFFRQNVHDWISPSGLFPNNYFQNVGDVREYGIELGARVRPIPGVTVNAAYTYSDFTFSKYVSATTNYTGNRLPGVPQHMIVGEVEYRHATGLHAAVEVKSASPFYFDDANTASNPRYTVLNLRTGYEFRRGRWELRPFFAITNLTDEKYSEFALINDAARRYYNPLSGLSFYGGLGVRYDQL